MKFKNTIAIVHAMLACLVCRNYIDVHYLESTHLIHWIYFWCVHGDREVTPLSQGMDVAWSYQLATR